MANTNQAARAAKMELKITARNADDTPQAVTSIDGRWTWYSHWRNVVRYDGREIYRGMYLAEGDLPETTVPAEIMDILPEFWDALEMTLATPAPKTYDYEPREQDADICSLCQSRCYGDCEA